jgi:hypothetical protein
MKKIESTLTLIFLCYLLLANLAKADVIPENDLNIPASQIRVKNSEIQVNENDYNFVLKLLYKIYAPVVKAKGEVDLLLKADWQDGTVNAYATREIETWTIHVPGGIARAPGMTKDSFALIVCHEIGHHLGGAPRTFLYEGWPSAEGQADYFATSKCLKRYYEELAHEEYSLENVPEKVVSDCNHAHPILKDVKVCIRSSMASIAFSNFLNELPGAKWKISINTPDSRVVKGTNTNDYPRPQCRLDTLYQGGLCAISSREENDIEDPLRGNCIDETKPGTRPRCWFKP